MTSPSEWTLIETGRRSIELGDSISQILNHESKTSGEISKLNQQVELFTGKLENHISKSSVEIDDLRLKMNEINQNLENQTNLLKSIAENQLKLLTDIKILRFDQEAIIKSMVTDGKKITCHGDNNQSANKSKVIFQNLYPNPFYMQRNLNWNIRSHKLSPFIPEHTLKLSS